MYSQCITLGHYQQAADTHQVVHDDKQDVMHVDKKSGMLGT